MEEYIVLMDEAGDLGIRRGTRWLVLTAVVVKKKDEATLRKQLQLIKQRLNVQEIHYREIKDFSKRAYVISELMDAPFTYMNLIMDTNQFDKAKIPDAEIAYNYLCKYLLQRVSGFLEDADGNAEVILSSRGTSRDGELIAYIKEKLLPYRHNHISEERFDKIHAKAASQWDLLQLADVCATSMFLSHEVNGWGINMPCFAKPLWPHLYKRNGEIDQFGIKYFQNSMKPEEAELCQHCICTKKKESPARLPHVRHAGQQTLANSGGILSST